MAIISLQFNYKGYENIALTLEGESGQDVLTKLEGCIAHLEKIGATPSAGHQPGALAGEAPTCKYHGPMKRSKKFNGWYCPKKLADGNYCDQKVMD